MNARGPLSTRRNLWSTPGRYFDAANRFATSFQFTTFHHAAM
jgi:hypothetical protein